MKTITLPALFLITIATTVCRASEPFVIEADPAGRPAVVVPFDAETKRGLDLERINALRRESRDPAIKLREAIAYLDEAIEKMTGSPLPTARNDTDLSRGIVLTTLEFAPPNVREDPQVIDALESHGENDLAANEAYYVRSEANRLLVVANRVDGLLAGVVTLLESVDYEVLGMGPNWVHVPDHTDRPLTFDLERSGQPNFYLRRLVAASAQAAGVGTVTDRRGSTVTLNHPNDEYVRDSYLRWLIGARLRGQSMQSFPGHRLQLFHHQVLMHMRETGETRGFLAPAIVGPLTDRPEPDPSLEGTMYIATDPDMPLQGKESLLVSVFSEDTEGEWGRRNPAYLRQALDLSVPYVREMVLKDMREKAIKHFESGSDKLFVYGTDPEDGGGYKQLHEHMSNPQWYAEYREAEGDPLDEPYALHGKFGLDQSVEQWDSSVTANHVFAFNDWLLREFEKSDSPLLRENAHRVRCSFFSYNYHDVPPTFNPDHRMRVMIAGYPKHRGRGRWKQIATPIDTAKALSIMLPDSPAGQYLIYSLAYFRDHELTQLAPRWDTGPSAVHADITARYEAGVRAVSAEMDFNFGKYGPGYYLLSKMLWNTDLTTEQLDALRDRYLRRAFGSGWKPMKRYNELFAAMPVNGPGTWGRLIRLIDEADQLIDPQHEPDAQRRIDDVKVYWLYYYLRDRGELEPGSEQLEEFLWKGQMSYQVAPFILTRRLYKENMLVNILSEEQMSGPAHYTAEETEQWWTKILAHWPEPKVHRFRDATLANGTAAGSVDVDDLVQVAEFTELESSAGLFRYNRTRNTPMFHTVAAETGDAVGFRFCWPVKDTDLEQRSLFSCRAWHRPTGSDKWVEVHDPALTNLLPELIENSWLNHPLLQVTVRLSAPEPGVYRFEMGRGGNGAALTGLNFDTRTGETVGPSRGATYTHLGDGKNQSAAYIYIPKGTPSLDLEVWEPRGQKKVTLFEGMPPSQPTPSREVDISAFGTHTIPLRPEETGTIAMINEQGFAMPYFYSVPQLWAMSPSDLLVPRAIAEADKLNILAPR